MKLRGTKKHVAVRATIGTRSSVGLWTLSDDFCCSPRSPCSLLAIPTFWTLFKSIDSSRMNVPPTAVRTRCMLMICRETWWRARAHADRLDLARFQQQLLICCTKAETSRRSTTCACSQPPPVLRPLECGRHESLRITTAQESWCPNATLAFLHFSPSDLQCFSFSMTVTHSRVRCFPLFGGFHGRSGFSYV